MRKNQKFKKTMSDINVTPFVDVMLVLLIIFMVTAPLLTSGIKINLPESSVILKNEKKDPVTVSINSKGEIFIQKKKFSKEQLIKKLSVLKKNNKNLKIYIKGDKKLDYGKVMDLMNLINSSGFKKVALVTKLK
ncbi:MAG: protein TolR [Alphaproteobacteria bacterium]